MESTELQQSFFNTVKNTLPPHISMVDRVAEILELSYDSVYRRIRGEKPITISELKMLCDHFRISLDQVLQIDSDAVVFHAPGINEAEIEFEAHIKGILNQLRFFNSFEKREMLYLCKDIPFWLFYAYPEIGAFKTFCWMKTFLNHPEFHNERFSLDKYPFDNCNKIGQQIQAEYCRLPSVELWSIESLNSSLLQLKYYKEAELFEHSSDFYAVVDSLEKTIDHFQKQAEEGFKFMPGAGELAHREPYRFYVNEVIIGNNTILVELDGSKYCFINYNILSYLMTKDKRFTQRNYQNFQNLISRSTMISGTGEKFRNKFFRELRSRVQALRQ
jgi:hypothetical protein